MAYTQEARGIRKSSAIITVAAPATPEVLYQLTQGGGVAARTVIVRKILAYSGVGASVLTIGVGLAPLVPIISDLLVVGGVDSGWTEDDIPEVEVGQDITLQASVAGIQVQVEVEEIE